MTSAHESGQGVRADGPPVATRPAPRRKRGTRTAKETEAHIRELEAIRDAIAGGAAILVYGPEGRIERAHPPLSSADGGGVPGYGDLPLEERAAIFRPREAAGAPIPHDRLPSVRMLRGEVLHEAQAPEMWVRAPDGRDIRVRVSGGPLRDASGAIVGAVGLYRDVTDMPRPEADRAGGGRPERTAAERLWAMQVLTDTALSHLTLEDLLPELLARVCDVMHVDNAAILLVDETGHTLSIRAVIGVEEVVAAQVRVPVGQGFAGRIAAMREPLVVDDLSSFPVVNSFLREQLRSAAGVPLLIGGRLLGVVHVGSAESRHFDEGDVHLLQRVADRVGIAVERARLYEAEHASRLAAEEAVRQAHEHAERARTRGDELRAILDTIADGVVVRSASGRIMETNPAFRALLAYDALPDDAAADPAAGLRLLDPRDEHGEAVPVDQMPGIRALRGDETSARDVQVRALDGRELTLNVAAAPLRDAERKVIGGVAVWRDVTERKRLERAVAEQAARLTATFDAIADAVVVFDRAGNLVELNPAARALFGVAGRPDYATSPERARAAGMALCELESGQPVPKEEWPSSRVLRGEVVGGPGGHAPDYILRMREGRQLAVSITGAPMRDARGDIEGAVMVIRDGTERRLLEREREEARSRAVAAVEVNERMEQFLTVAAHDIRNPIAVVRGHVQIALRRARRLRARAQGLENPAERGAGVGGDDSGAGVGGDDSGAGVGGDDSGAGEAVPDVAVRALEAPRARDIIWRALEEPFASIEESLREASAGADRLVRIAARLFDVARARVGRIALRLVPCDMTAIVREQVAAQRAAIPDRTIRLSAPGPADGPIPVLADPDQLGQVLANYLTNALKYSAPDRPVEVSVEACEGLACVAVRDEGPGLPLLEQVRVWEVFHRAPGVEVRSASPDMESLGLGLHICKRIVEQHPGGRVGVESMVDYGSTFWFTLPLAPEASDAGRAPADA